MSFLLPASTCVHFFIEHRVRRSYISAFYARRCSPNFAKSRSRALRSSNFRNKNSPRALLICTRSNLNPRPLTLVGTRFTYFVGDADYAMQRLIDNNATTSTTAARRERERAVIYGRRERERQGGGGRGTGRLVTSMVDHGV